MLHAKQLLHIDALTRSCRLTERATPAALEALATATIVATSHSVLHVRLASLTMLQQILIKVMPLLTLALALALALAPPTLAPTLAYP